MHHLIPRLALWVENSLGPWSLVSIVFASIGPCASGSCIDSRSRRLEIHGSIFSVRQNRIDWLSFFFGGGGETMIGRLMMLVVGLWSIAVIGRARGPGGSRSTRKSGGGAGRCRSRRLAGHRYQGAVSAGGRDAVAAGLEILKKGGNAADGGAATILALSVTDSRAFCFGGEVPIMVYDAQSHGVTVIAGQGAAPRLATLDHFKGAAESRPAGSRLRPFRPRSMPVSRCSTGLAR